MRFGITIDNKWDGKIIELEELVITIPDGMNITTHNFVKVKNKKDNVWELDSATRKRIKSAGGINKERTFNFAMKMPNTTAANKLLNNVALVTKYIKVEAEYNYQMKESVSVKLKKGDGVKSLLLRCTEFCRDEDGCDCNEECPKGDYANEVYDGYNCNGEYKEATIVDSIIAVGSNVVSWGDGVVKDVIDYVSVDRKQRIKDIQSGKFTQLKGGKPTGDPTWKDVFITVYYTAYEPDFSKWTTTNNPDLTGTEACKLKGEKGFYEAVRCEGSGITKDGLVCSAGQKFMKDRIQPTLKASIANGACRQPKNKDDRGSTSIAVNRVPGTVGYIEYGSAVYIDFGDGHSETGWYIAEDTGSLFNGKAKIDIYGGVGKAQFNKLISTGISRKQVSVWKQ